jgi:Fe-S-cluster containining protein
LRAFDALDLALDDPFCAAHPDLVVEGFGRPQLQSRNGRCPLLTGDGGPERPYRCADHANRPRTCRSFAAGGEACVQARALVGFNHKECAA